MYSPHYNDNPPIKRNIFIKLMHLLTQGLFLYNNNKLYQQMDSVAMGYPLVPTMANFLIRHIETIIMPDHPKMYVRYVDDIFCSFQ